MLTLQQTADVRKLIVLVSDGDDDYSRATEDGSDQDVPARGDDHLHDQHEHRAEPRTRATICCCKISDATGGQAFFPMRMEDVAEGFQKIEAELRSQYLLVYVPADFRQDGSFRTIYLQSSGSAVHRAREEGYFAPKPPE